MSHNKSDGDVAEPSQMPASAEIKNLSTGDHYHLVSVSFSFTAEKSATTIWSSGFICYIIKDSVCSWQHDQNLSIAVEKRRTQSSTANFWHQGWL